MSCLNRSIDDLGDLGNSSRGQLRGTLRIIHAVAYRNELTDMRSPTHSHLRALLDDLGSGTYVVRTVDAEGIR